MIRKISFLIFLIFLSSAGVMAQQEISGKVLDENNEALVGVNVVVVGTTNGAITNFDGEFAISAPAEAVLLFSSIGYADQEVEVAGKTYLEVVMQPDLVALDEVVVTALGIEREKKALGYSVQEVNADDITQGGDANVIGALQGKVAGVEINQTAGGIGGSSRIEIRGLSSLTGNDEPLWVVDGIPFDNGNSNDGGIWGGISRSGGAYDINPDDVESISVLKGPNAAALYGERGGNGVIIVTTKKGSRNKSLGVSYSGNFSVSEAAYMLDLQDQYGQGQAGVYDMNGTAAWGPKMEGQMLESWTGETIPYEAQPGRLADFCNTASSQNHSLAFSGGNDQGSFRASIGKDFSNGIYSGHKVEKTTFDLRSDYDVNKWLNIDAKVSYLNTKGQERPEIGYYSYIAYYNAMPMNIRNEDLAPGYDIVAAEHVEKLYTTANANYRNPYFLQGQTTNYDDKNRFFGYAAANLKITDGLTAMFRYGMDTYAFTAVSGYLWGDNVSSTRPDYNANYKNFTESNMEMLISYKKDLGDISFNLNYGASSMYQIAKTLTGTSGMLASEGDFFLGNGTNKNASESLVEMATRSMYAFGQVSFKNYLFLDATARRDASSTLTSATGEFDNTYFYPSVSFSGIVSEMLDLPDAITFAKVRASWAQVGKATDPYLANQTFSVGSWNYNLLNSSVPSLQVVQNLAPELSTSWEIGFDARFFENRVGIDFTYYNENTKNQILAVNLDQSTGYSQKLINAGLINNKGIEAVLSTTPVRTSDFRLDVNFNFAKNIGKVIELENLNDSTAIKTYNFGDINGSPRVYAEEGGFLGDIEGFSYKRDEAGNILIGDDGLPLRSDQMEYLGNLQADWTGAVALKADYKGLYVSALVSIRKGGEIISVSEQGATGSGTALRTIENDRLSVFADGISETTGEDNLIMSSAQAYYSRLASIEEEFVYDASHAKLKELSIGYRLPSSIVSKVPGDFLQSARLSVFGRNLFYFYKHTPGTVPDASAYSTSYTAQAFDFSPVPSTRTFGFTLNVGF